LSIVDNRPHITEAIPSLILRNNVNGLKKGSHFFRYGSGSACDAANVDMYEVPLGGGDIFIFPKDAYFIPFGHSCVKAIMDYSLCSFVCDFLSK